MGGPLRPCKSVAAIVLIIIAYSLCAAASCYGRDPCPGVNSLPGIPLQALGVEPDCESPSSTSPFAATRGRRLGGSDATGMRLSVSRRSSHPLEADLHSTVLLQQSLQRDLHRIKGAAKRAVMAKASTRSNFRTNFPDIVQTEEEKPQAPDENSTSKLYKFESAVESGVTLGSGEYFMDLYVGTPPKHVSVIIDTGSDLTWVQCDPCDLCYHQEGPVFQPAQSSTYEGLTCNLANCKSAGGFNNDVDSCQKTSKNPGVCRYFYYYGDLSNTTGDFALDTITFNASKGDPLQIGDILFGCGHSNIGLFQGAGGLLGLGQGAISFVSQVGNLFGDKFSYCLVDRDNAVDVRSPLIFGEDEVYAGLESRLQWTPFLKNTPIDTFYYINITGMSVAGQVLRIPDSAWQIDREGNGGTIIDSGTTLSYFRQDVYQAIKAAFEARIPYPKVTSVPVLNLCYNVTEVPNADFPSFSITFEGNAVMDLPLKNYFIRPAPAEEVYCLALLGVPISSLSIIGNFQQQNFHVVYDRGNSQLGFAPVDCTAVL